ncbi:carboxyl transferase domain-containing protein [Mycolicibacterium sp. CBMA 361]|uniref:carboxyl transferase domain-containing protein n=1 Tax=Mycolicibacterium sp. CBMA 361 TaxID=2606610 RepID=UPI0012DBCB39|nr:carboxyl transferase domain-containing protein [Mycolicibacterium sp. CBMA 361]MUM32714.1 hypothetical protein [Mycolicibacterium sp. CBMA 361]
MTTLAPEATAAESLDPRDPLLRLSTFFDPGSVKPLHERDKSGVLAASGTVNGVHTIAFATDGTVMGGAMGVDGCAHIVRAYDTAIDDQAPIDDELDTYERGRRLVGLFCQQGHFDRAKAEAGDTDIRALMPESARRAYDVHPIVEALLDEGVPFEEFQSKWAPSIVVGLGRLAGRSVGVIANNPLRLGGCLNSESAEKAARFVRLCDAFGIPLIVLVDVPGYLPGVDQEWGGVVRRGAKLLHAFGEAEVPRVTLVTRKIYGGAYIAMNSRSLGASKVFAWPDAEVAVMGAKAAVGILHKRKLAAVEDAAERDALHEELALEHERIAGGVDSAIDIGVVDEKIDPAHTRSKITQALAEAPARRGRHKNIAL